MRALRRRLEAQLDTPWLLVSRQQIIADELCLHLEDHRCSLVEEGVPKDVAVAEAWATFGALKPLAGEFLAQHRLEAYAFYCTYLVFFAAVLWPLPELINQWFTGAPVTAAAFGQRLLVTWELFWLFVLVRTAHCVASGPIRRWVVISLLFPGYLLLGLLGPFIISYMFKESLSAPWLHWFNPDWIAGWMALLQTNQPNWILAEEAPRTSYMISVIIGLYLIRAYVIEECWQGRDWPRLLIMTLLLSVGLAIFFDAPKVHALVEMVSKIDVWSLATPQQKVLAWCLALVKHLLLAGYFLGGLRAFDALYGYVLRNRGRVVTRTEAATA